MFAFCTGSGVTRTEKLCRLANRLLGLTYKAETCRGADPRLVRPLVIRWIIEGASLTALFVKLVFERKSDLGKKTAQFLLAFDF